MDENEQYDSELEEFPEEAKERADQRDIGDYSLLRRIQTAPFSSNIKMVRTKTAIMGIFIQAKWYRGWIWRKCRRFIYEKW